ncbi:efflux RND transporter periplasmic adaptor subunit [Mucilaginibacter pallidiroseus]|uniref:Efflux RND transporter periplasmic adaptor subunit n=1 Tax=Mucilaginibacter pallidiroseus TaxID=2599295 RepID=A0A563UHY8_9SPHI|nr:efflux RND transporter periplasmic adaptor subunit [Mucilaginibacter pallidiroseus]TWR31004.1 efflux RND transporter periplasmic adaptor subunit [Mucilaginibacter pallidiroseus]
MKNKYTFWIAALALVSASACKSGGEKKPAAMPPTLVNVATVEKADALYYDQYQGLVVALNAVELRAQVGGFITGIFFKEGNVVQKGAPLYEIDKRKYAAAYEQAVANVTSAKANLNKAKKDIERYNMLLKNDAVARQTVDQATATYQTAQSQVAVAEAARTSAATDLSYATIRAPFTGRIGISQVKLGAQITPGTTLLNTISSGNPIGVDVVINEQDIDRFYKLQKSSTDTTFRLQINGGNNYNHTGKIFAIDRGVNNGTGTVKVRVQFPNPNDELKDGMSCVLRVLNDDSGNRVQIPYAAITEQMGEFFVFIAKDTVAEQRKVTLGPRINSNIVIMKGIEQGEKLITAGFQRLRDGGKISLGQQGAAAPKDAKGTAK